MSPLSVWSPQYANHAVQNTCSETNGLPDPRLAYRRERMLTKATKGVSEEENAAV